MAPATRKQITQPPDWWVAFEKQANAEGMTLSEWVGWACKAKLPRGIGIHAGLSERGTRGRPPKAKDYIRITQRVAGATLSRSSGLTEVRFLRCD